MRKEELRKMKRINATDKMVQLAKENNRKTLCEAWPGRKVYKDTVYDVMVRCQTRGEYLMVCIFFPEKIEAGELTPSYEIYCNPQGDEYITRILDKGEEQRWSKAMLNNIDRMSVLMYGNWHYWDRLKNRIWQNPEGKVTIQKFLQTEKKGIFGLIEWQKMTRDKKIKEAERRQQEPWDRDMKLIPPLVRSFEDWMKKEAAGEYFIFYEYSRKGAETGYCSHCGKEVPIKNPKHNRKGKCSKCGVNVTYKVASKIQTLGTGWYKGQIIQKIDGGAVIRTFEQNQWYRNADYRNPNYCTNETERILLMGDGKVKRYYYGLYKNKKMRWIQDSTYFPEKSSLYHQMTVKIFRRNMSALKKTVFQNSAIDLWEELPTDVANYLAIERGNPVVEKLARIGMFQMAKDFIRHKYESKLLDEEATELTKILKIDAARLKRLKGIQGKIGHLRWYQMEKIENRAWPDEMIKDFGDNNLFPDSFDFLGEKMSYIKIWNYLKKQSIRSGQSMRQLHTTWRDYLNMAKKAEYNLESEMIYKPKDLQEAHQEVIMVLQNGKMEEEAKELEKKWPKVNENVQKLKKFEYADKKYTILAPKSILDIVKEGTALRHCVHTCDFYFDRIQRDESYLFFLRKTGQEKKPWYTLEVEPSGNIRQKRTIGDNQNEDFKEAVKFLRKWQKVFRKRMTKEEELLGIQSEQARIKEYEELRINGNKVWHGKLAGQLLVDVLEKDFMAAI